MKYLFDNTDKIERLREFCEPWRGTPFRHHSGQPGIGCDCIHFVIKGLEHLGFGHIDIPWYEKHFHLHNCEEVLLNGLRREIPGVELLPNNPINGDLILYKFGYVMSHIGWFLDDHVWSAMVDAKLNSRIWQDKNWYSRRRLIYRILDNE